MDWVGRDGLNPDTHETYLTDFVNHFYKNVIKMIDRAMKKENVNLSSPLLYEILYHLHECKKSAANFFDREIELRKIRNYIEGEENSPFFIFGKGGSGKTGLISKVCELVRSDWSREGENLSSIVCPDCHCRQEAPGDSEAVRPVSLQQLPPPPPQIHLSANILQSQPQPGLRPLRPGPHSNLPPGYHEESYRATQDLHIS